MPVDSDQLRSFIYRRAEASMLLEWSRTIEAHGLNYSSWKASSALQRESWKGTASASAYSNPPQHTKSRKTKRIGRAKQTTN